MGNRIAVDRIEGAIAVCEAEDRQMLRIALAELPPGVAEGDVLRPLPDGGWARDEEETRRRRERNRELFERLRGER